MSGVWEYLREDKVGKSRYKERKKILNPQANVIKILLSLYKENKTNSNNYFLNWILPNSCVFYYLYNTRNFTQPKKKGIKLTQKDEKIAENVNMVSSLL